MNTLKTAIYLILIAFACSLLTPAYAQSFLCTNTYKYINIGDSIATVEQACGKPVSSSTKDVPAATRIPTEQWYYQGGNMGDAQMDGEINFEVAFEHNTKKRPLLIITFEDNKVTGVSLGGQGVGSTSVCGEDELIQVGDSPSKVERLCGTAAVRNAGTRTSYRNLTKQTILTYQFDSFQPPLVLTFEAGVLTSIQNQ